MKKPKKITVKPFLNDKLDPIEASIHDSEGKVTKELQYPLYYMVIYNRNNTKFKSRLGFYYSGIENVPETIIEFESNTIEKILRYQISKSGEDVDLRGLGNAFNILSENLFQCVEKYLKNKLKLAAMSADSYLSFMINFEDWRNPFSKYYDVVTSLFGKISKYIKDDFKIEIEAYNNYYNIYKKYEKQQSGFCQSTLIDWLNDEHKSFILQEMNNEKETANIIHLIEKAVEKSMRRID
ncbi:MAG: hypothetical protein V2I54_05770 [Bacteroidales bacterium]|jgi:hypothetical protein|nr:hypothetical protein [Bacteroidales bacterium]